MKTIWKYNISNQADCVVPEKAEILSVQMQGDDICIWMLVDTENKDELRQFVAVSTGWEYPQEMGLTHIYIGTVQQNGFVWHILERKGA